MSSNAIEFINVFKKFHKGERNDSLRDLIPYLSKKILFRSKNDQLREEDFWAVKNVSFQLKKGESLGIIGPNGAGKSTILKLLSGILRPNYGELHIHGRLSSLIEVGAGFHPDLTGRENIYLNGAIMGMRKEEIKNKFETIVDFSGISEFIDTPVKRYSSGMYARLGFSIAAHVDPEILLIDEVLSVGDFSFQLKCLKKIQEAIDNGTTVIFISHNLPSVITLCQNTILLNKGEIHKYGETKQVCRYYYKIYSDNRKATEDQCFTLQDMELYSSNGTPSSSFKPGEWAKLKFKVESKIQIDSLIMSFYLKKNDGMIVFDASSDVINNKYYSFNENETKEIELNFRINLPEAAYFVGINMFDPEKGFYLYVDEGIEFYVSAPKTGGYAYVDLKW